MRTFLLSTTVLAAVMAAGAAHAADMPTKAIVKAPPLAPAFSWTGFYIGVHGGYGWGKNDWRDFVDPINGPNTLGPDTPHYDIKGALAGGQIGYNWQFNQIVLGIEADASWADIKGHGTVFSANLGDNCLQSGDACRTKIDALGTITGRLGYAIDHTLLYAKGGAAWAHVKNHAGFTTPADPANYTADPSDTRWGWTVGAGAEFAFAPNWSAKIEYNFIDLGKDRVDFVYSPTQTFGASAKADETLHVIKAGVNYRF